MCRTLSTKTTFGYSTRPSGQYRLLRILPRGLFGEGFWRLKTVLLHDEAELSNIRRLECGPPGFGF